MVTGVSSGERRPRSRNRRGEGGKLRGDILAAAASILELSGQEGDVTLRAIAREVGIAAPSIYRHFANRDEILAALIAEAFSALETALMQPTIERLPDPVDRLRAGCVAYLEFARTRPNEYRVLFQNRRPAGLDADLDPEQMLGWKAFAILIDRLKDCAAIGRSASVEHFADATAVWVALHGLATLDTAIPSFPWPDRDALLDHLILSLARIDG